MRRPHRPRGVCPLRVSSAAEYYLTIPCRSLSLTRSLFRMAGSRAATARARPSVGFLRCRRPRVGHSGDGRSDSWYLDQGRSNPPSFVSRNTLVSKRLSNLPGRQQLAGRTHLIMPLIGADFSGPSLPWGWAETAQVRRPTAVTAEPRESGDPSGVRGSVEQVSKGNGADFSCKPQRRQRLKRMACLA